MASKLNSWGGSKLPDINFEDYLVDSHGSYALYKVAPYLYDIYFSNYNYDPAFFKNRFWPGGCSSFRKGNYYVRNLDWNVKINDKDTAIFRVFTPNKDGRYATMGVAANVVGLEEGSFNYDIMKHLPYMIGDGINEKGLCCNLNVVPHDQLEIATKTLQDGETLANPEGLTTGTNPGKLSMCEKSVLRYILDYAATVDEAIELLDNLNIYGINTSDRGKQDLHYMIADANKTVCVEFVNNKVKVIPLGGDGQLPEIMTNFYLTGFHGNLSTKYNTENYTTNEELTSHAAGIERYNTISENLSSVTNLATAESLAESIFYSHYLDEANEWFSEYLENYGENQDVTIHNAEYVDGNNLKVAVEYANSTEEGRWFTTYTAIYDLQNFTMYLLLREDLDSLPETGMWTSKLGDLKFKIL